MWIVFCTQTGEEMDSFESGLEASKCANKLEAESGWRCETFDLRWEA